MKFTYREYVSQMTGIADFRLIMRPVISIAVSGPHAVVQCQALVDTGADETILPLSFAKALGVKFDPQLTSLASGVTGDTLTMNYGEVEFRIDDGTESVQWSTIVGFVDFGRSADDVVILGHGGCLDYFTAIFDGERAELELIPN
jgi:hypothetical protein